MNQPRVFKAVGITLLGAGAIIVLLGLSGGGSALRIVGPVVGFLGIVLLAQSKGHS